MTIKIENKNVCMFQYVYTVNFNKYCTYSYKEYQMFNLDNNLNKIIEINKIYEICNYEELKFLNSELEIMFHKFITSLQFTKKTEQTTNFIRKLKNIYIIIQLEMDIVENREKINAKSVKIDVEYITLTKILNREEFNQTINNVVVNFCKNYENHQKNIANFIEKYGYDPQYSLKAIYNLSDLNYLKEYFIKFDKIIDEYNFTPNIKNIIKSVNNKYISMFK